MRERERERKRGGVWLRHAERWIHWHFKKAKAQGASPSESFISPLFLDCLVFLSLEAPGLLYQASDVLQHRTVAPDCSWHGLKPASWGGQVGAPHVLSSCQPWKHLMGTQMPQAALCSSHRDGLAVAGIRPPAPRGPRLTLVTSTGFSLLLPSLPSLWPCLVWGFLGNHTGSIAGSVPAMPACIRAWTLEQSGAVGGGREKIRSQVVSARAFPGQPRFPWLECCSPWKLKM